MSATFYALKTVGHFPTHTIECRPLASPQISAKMCRTKNGSSDFIVFETVLNLVRFMFQAFMVAYFKSLGDPMTKLYRNKRAAMDRQGIVMEDVLDGEDQDPEDLDDNPDLLSRVKRSSGKQKSKSSSR